MEFVDEIEDVDYDSIVYLIIKEAKRKNATADIRKANKADIDNRLKAQTTRSLDFAIITDPLTTIPISDREEGLILRLFRYISLWAHPDKASADMSRYFISASTAKTNGDIVSLLIIYYRIKGLVNGRFSWIASDETVLYDIYHNIQSASKDVFDEWNGWDEPRKNAYIKATMKANNLI